MKKLLLATTALCAFALPSVASADPITAAIAATVSAASATGFAAFTFAGLAPGLASFVGSVLFRAALGYALNSLTTRSSGTVSRGYTVNAIGPAQPHQIIYGEVLVGGVVTYQTLTTDTTTNDLLHRVICFAGHEIDSYQAIYVDGEEVTLDGSGNVTAPAKWVGLIRIKQHLGTDTQAADADLVSEVTEWTTAHQGKGIAYLYARFKGASNFQNGVPVVTAKIRGRKVDGFGFSDTWSSNPANCLRDYLKADFGLGIAASRLATGHFNFAEEVCDDLVGGLPQYTINGAFLVDAAPEDIVRAMSSAMAATFYRQGTRWAVRAAFYEEPAISFTDDDLRGPVTVNTRHSAKDNFNTVTGLYRGEETNWQPDNYEPVSGAGYIAEDNGIERAVDLELQFTDTEAMARRIAQIFLRRNRYQKTVRTQLGARALDLTIGQTCQITNTAMGWTDKVFECVDWALNIGSGGELVVDVILREIEEGVFTGVFDALTDESGNALTDESGNVLEGVVA
jgi:hypothetical protein